MYFHQRKIISFLSNKIITNIYFFQQNHFQKQFYVTQKLLSREDDSRELKRKTIFTYSQILMYKLILIYILNEILDVISTFLRL